MCKFNYKTIKENIQEVAKDSKALIKKCENWHEQHKKQTFIVGIIDERYYLTGYIIRWAQVQISKILFDEYINKSKGSKTVILSMRDIFTIEEDYQKYVKYETEELNGYEIDTPNSFDYLIQ